MYCTFLLFASLLICQVSTEPIERIILDYFKSESVRKFRKEWEHDRKPLEHAITSALKETVGYTGMNVYIRKQRAPLASGYYHNDNQVRIIFSDLNLEELPRCWMPEVQFSLASNVIKIQSTLTKMIVHADYVTVRNKTDILYEPKDQNPYKSSPFLFQQVRDVGKVAISMDSCILKGFIIASLNGESVNLGYDHLRLLNCQYNIEIYRPGEDSPPVIAKYNPYRDDDGLHLTHLVMKPISEELVPKLQGTLFSFINTSSIFDEDLRDFRENQEVVFQSTWSYLTEIIRNLNRITVKKNGGAIELKDTSIYWDDGRIKPSKNKTTVGESLALTEVVLTGLDTLYCAHSGGPYKMKTVMIGEEIRFSSLQIRGYLEIKSTWSDKYAFAVEINDMVVDLQMDVNLDQAHEQSPSKKNGFKTLDVTGFGRMVFTAPSVMFGSAESMISGYLLSEVPKQLKSHLKSIFPEGLHTPKKPPVKDTPNAQKVNVNVDKSESLSDVVVYESYEIEVEEPKEPQKLTTNKLNGKRVRSMLKKSKKRYKSANRPRRHHRSGDGVHDIYNQIRK